MTRDNGADDESSIAVVCGECEEGGREEDEGKFKWSVDNKDKGTEGTPLIYDDEPEGRRARGLSAVSVASAFSRKGRSR